MENVIEVIDMESGNEVIEAIAEVAPMHSGRGAKVAGIITGVLAVAGVVVFGVRKLKARKAEAKGELHEVDTESDYESDTDDSENID